MDRLLRLVLDLYRAAQDTPAAEFQDLALQMFKAVVPFQTATWTNAEITRKRLEIFSVHLHNEPVEMLRDFTALNRKHTNAVDLAANRPGRSVIYHAPDLYPNADDAPMLEYIKRYGHERTLMITDADRAQWLSFYRPDRDDQFSENDGAVLSDLMAHFAEALAINRALMLGEQTQRDPRRRAGTRALIDARGRFLHCGKRFLDLLRREWPDWSEPKLPTVLLRALRRSKAPICHGSIILTAEAMGDATMVVARPVSSLDRLSPRELLIAREFGAGKSYKVIANEIQLAPATVRNMLQNAYRKLGIGNKTALTRLLELERS
jgi:DNA-binding CsgD family transcriptional regulator